MQDFFNVSSGQSVQTNRVAAAIKTTNSNSVESVPSATGEMWLASDEESFFWESEQEDAEQVAGPGQQFFSSSDDDKATSPKVLDMDMNSGKSEGLFMPSSDSDLESGRNGGPGHDKPESGGCPSSLSKQRRVAGTAQFLGKPVCVRALSRLLGQEHKACKAETSSVWILS